MSYFEDYDELIDLNRCIRVYNVANTFDSIMSDSKTEVHERSRRKNRKWMNDEFIALCDEFRDTKKQKKIIKCKFRIQDL